MDRLDKIVKAKKLKGMKWRELAEDLPISGEGIRIAFSRRNVSEEYLEVIEKKLGIISDLEEQKNFDKKPESFEEQIARKVFQLLESELKQTRNQIEELRDEIRNLKKSLQ